MDWARAKSLFIVIFVFLNTFLFLYILDYRAGEDISKDAVANTTQVMEERGIQLECEIPLGISTVQKLSCENTSLDKVMVREKLLGNYFVLEKDFDDTFTAGSRKLVFLNDSHFVLNDRDPKDSVDIFDSGKAEKYIRNYVGDIDIDTSSYKMDDYVIGPDNTAEFLMVYRYKGYPVFDRVIKGTLDRKGMIQLECHVIEIKGLSGDKLEIIPAYKILLSQFEMGEKTVISSIRLGFKGTTGLDAGMKETQEGPVWRIGIKDSKPRDFSAYSGEEIFGSVD